MQQITKPSSGINVLGLLGILFTGLKLAGIIDWSWWWVTLPFWIGIAIVAAIYLVVVISVLIVRCLSPRND